MSDRLTVAIDFDGVLYSGEWQSDEDTSGKPVDGAGEFLSWVLKKYRVVIYSTRCDSSGGRSAVAKWLERHGFPKPKAGVLELGSPREVAAHVYVDDRGYRFNGTFEGVRQFLVENQSLRTWRESTYGGREGAGQEDQSCTVPTEQLAQWQRLQARPTPTDVRGTAGAPAPMPATGSAPLVRTLRRVTTVPSGSVRAAGVPRMTATCATTASKGAP